MLVTLVNYLFDFLLQNTILSALFGLALLPGAISNSVYSADNKDLYYDLRCDHYFELKLCEDLERVYSSEASAAVSSRIASNCNMYVSKHLLII